MKIKRTRSVKVSDRVILDLNIDEADELRDFLDPQCPFFRLQESNRLIQILDQLRRLDSLPVEEVTATESVPIPDGALTVRLLTTDGKVPRNTMGNMEHGELAEIVRVALATRGYHGIRPLVTFEEIPEILR